MNCNCDTLKDAIQCEFCNKLESSTIFHLIVKAGWQIGEIISVNNSTLIADYNDHIKVFELNGNTYTVIDKIK